MLLVDATHHEYDVTLLDVLLNVQVVPDCDKEGVSAICVATVFDAADVLFPVLFAPAYAVTKQYKEPFKL